MRVRVHSGDGSTCLGEGDYVGDVQVFYFRMPDGSLSSLSDCEGSPPDELVRDMESIGAELCSMGDNPKIVLDSGDVVYGCQVWWQEVDPSLAAKYGSKHIREEPDGH